MLKDTLVHFNPGVSWELAVPNGRYRVVVSVGDSEFGCPHVEFNVEGERALNDVSHAGGEFLVVDRIVEVRDGHLTLSSHSRPERESATRLNFVCVERE